MALCAVVCAFAVLLSLSLCPVMPLKRFVFDFRVFVGVIGGVRGFRAIMGEFKALTVAPALPLSLGASSRAVLRSVIRSGVAPLPSVAGELLKVYPLPYYVLMRGCAVLPPITHIKIIFRKTYTSTYTFQKTI